MQVSSPDDQILNQVMHCNSSGAAKWDISSYGPNNLGPLCLWQCFAFSADHEERGRGSRYWKGGTLTGFEGGFALHGQQRALCAAAHVHGQRAPHQALCAAVHQTQWAKGWRQWGRTVSGHKSSLTRWVGAYSSVSAHPKMTNTSLENPDNKNLKVI